MAAAQYQTEFLFFYSRKIVVFMEIKPTKAVKLICLTLFGQTICTVHRKLIFRPKLIRLPGNSPKKRSKKLEI